MTRYISGFIADFAVVLVIAGHFPTFCPPAYGGPAPVITTGCDWSLPTWVKPAPYSGIFCAGHFPKNRALDKILLTTTWAALNPSEGVWRFDLLTGALQAARTGGYKIVMRIKCSETYNVQPYGQEEPFVPQWVLDKHNPRIFFTNTDSSIAVAAPWDTGVTSEFLRFMAEFKKHTEIPADTNLAGMYVHAISSSSGEEFWLDWRMFDYFAFTVGTTCEQICNAFKPRIDAWVDVFGAYSYKLAWVVAGMNAPCDKAAREINDYAISKGLGLRSGGSEILYWDILGGHSWGQILTDSGYSLPREPFAPADEKRYFGAEDEVWQNCTDTACTLMWQASLVKTAQLRMNMMWTSEDGIALDSNALTWYSLVAGKSPAQTPDAICMLYEIPHNSRSPLRNIEHYLYQRELPGATTRPAVPVRRYAMSFDPDDRHVDYTARSTDAAAGQTAILLKLHDTFRASLSGAVSVRVTYFDGGAGVWVVETGDAQGAIVTSEPIRMTGSNAWRTASIEFPSPPKAGTFSGMDIRLRHVSGADLVARYVRVVRTGLPAVLAEDGRRGINQRPDGSIAPRLRGRHDRGRECAVFTPAGKMVWRGAFQGGILAATMQSLLPVGIYVVRLEDPHLTISTTIIAGR